MTTAVCWETAGDRLPPEIKTCLEASTEPRLHGLQLLFAVPEWEVPLPGGETSSHTDVLALARNELGLVLLAVEAKVDEEFGPTLGDKRQGASTGQLERIAYLHSVLKLHSQVSDVVRYQLLHRTASAILVARDFHAPIAVMMVQSFSPDERWRPDFLAFAAALQCPANGLSLAQVPGHKDPDLFLAWCKGEQRHREVDLRAAV